MKLFVYLSCFFYPNEVIRTYDLPTPVMDTLSKRILTPPDSSSLFWRKGESRGKVYASPTVKIWIRGKKPFRKDGSIRDVPEENKS